MNWRKGDFIVILLVLIPALGLLGLRALPVSSGNRVLRVELNGVLLQEIPIYDHSQDQVVIQLPAGEAVVEILDGRVRVLPMPKEICPLGLCSSIGWVNRSGDAIVCLPNRLVLTMVGGQVDEVWESLDGVTK